MEHGLAAINQTAKGIANYKNEGVIIKAGVAVKEQLIILKITDNGEINYHPISPLMGRIECNAADTHATLDIDDISNIVVKYGMSCAPIMDAIRGMDDHIEFV